MQRAVIGHANDEGTPSLRFARCKETRVRVRWKGFILAADKTVLLRLLRLPCRRHDSTAQTGVRGYIHRWHDLSRRVAWPRRMQTTVNRPGMPT